MPYLLLLLFNMRLSQHNEVYCHCYCCSLVLYSVHQHKAPQYLTDCITPASDIASRQRLRSASRHQLLVPRYQLSSLGRRSFAVAGPMTCNSLSADLRDQTFIENILVR